MPRTDADVTGERDNAKEMVMMMWYGSDINGWGYALMIVGMVIFWALIATGLVALFHYSGNGASASPGAGPRTHRPTAQQILAERFAHGEIEEDEYLRRLNTLDGHGSR